MKRLLVRVRSTSRLGLAVWFALMLVVCSTLLSRHLLALPRPSADAAFARSMASLRGPADEGRWMLVHVLYAECRCSQRIADHLMTTARPTDVREHVLLVGTDADLESKLIAHGFLLARVDQSELHDRYHVDAVPLLIVAAPDGSIRYAGGYTPRKQGLDSQDLEILASTRASRVVDALPVFGCAVARRLQSAINPLGLP